MQFLFQACLYVKWDFILLWQCNSTKPCSVNSTSFRWRKPVQVLHLFMKFPPFVQFAKLVNSIFLHFCFLHVMVLFLSLGPLRQAKIIYINFLLRQKECIGQLNHSTTSISYRDMEIILWSTWESNAGDWFWRHWKNKLWSTSKSSNTLLK